MEQPSWWLSIPPHPSRPSSPPSSTGTTKVTTQQQTERERLAGLLEREASSYTSVGNQAQWADELRKAAALLRSDEPAKPDRYVEIAEEITSAANIVSHGGYYELDIDAAAAVLRRYFEPPSEVVEAAHTFKREGDFDAAGIMAGHILKGDV